MTGQARHADGSVRRTGRHKHSARLVVIALFFVAMLAGMSGTSNAAPAGQKVAGCSENSAYTSGIKVTQTSQGFKISVTPTVWSRVWGTGPGMDAVTWTMWHSVQGCVSGLYGNLADSIYQQLDCHRYFGFAQFATGSTYDLESWHKPLKDVTTRGYIGSRCLNDDAAKSGVTTRK